MVVMKSIVSTAKAVAIRPRNNDKLEILRWDPISKLHAVVDFEANCVLHIRSPATMHISRGEKAQELQAINTPITVLQLRSEDTFIKIVVHKTVKI